MRLNPQKICRLASAQLNGNSSLHSLFAKPSICEITVPSDSLAAGDEIHNFRFLAISEQSHGEDVILRCKYGFYMEVCFWDSLPLR